MAGSYKLKTETKPAAPATPVATRPAAPAPTPGRPGPPSVPPLPPAGKTAVVPTPPAGARLASLDAYRGLIMILLAAGGFGIARFAALPESAAVWQRPVATAEGVVEPASAELVQSRRDWWQTLAFQFEHPAWRSDFLPFKAADSAQTSDWLRIGVSLWDLIQPAFMFMVGAAMPFSYRRRKLMGEPTAARVGHAFLRALILILLGVFLATKVGAPTQWIFTNVLAQIGLGYFFVYLLLGFRWPVQLVACLLILGGYWYFMQLGYWQLTGKPQPTGEYDFAAVGVKPEQGEALAGRFAPWSKNDNAAHQVDLVLLNKLADPNAAAMTEWRSKAEAGPLTFGEKFQRSIRQIFFANPSEFRFNGGGYQTLNFIPSMATMLMGVMCGTFLMGTATPGRKVVILLLAALACLILGRVAGIYLCPIVKRIWTPSWALFSGGYVIALLAISYLLFDVLPLKKLAFPLVVVGMNSMVMYMMGQLMRGFTREHVVQPHMTGAMETLLGTDPVRDGPHYLLADDMYGRLAEPWAVLLVFWLIVFWLYRQKIFVRV
jgi:heparan-alpha-glucosaminide N-acetyltransferase